MSRSIVVDPSLKLVAAADVRDRFPNSEVVDPEDVVAALEAAAGPTVLVSSNRCWRDAYLDGLAPGDWVTTIGIGYDAFPVEAFADEGVAFTNSPAVNVPQVAEHAFATAFSVSRDLWTYRDQQRAHEWEKGYSRTTDLAGDVCCVLGLGSVGEAIAERAGAFGMTVRGVKRTIEGYDGAADAVYRSADLREALRGARLFVIAVPQTPETEGMISREAFSALADDAIVVNVARGPVVDTDALVSALDDGEIRAACLDVTEPEPLPPGHALWDREDVVLTPHVAGVSDKYADRFLDLFGEQYEAWRAGRELRHRVA